MNPIVKVSGAVLIGLICGALAGTIVGSAYLTLALRLDLLQFDMFTMWTLPEVRRTLHPEAFKVAYGAVALASAGFGIAAFVWTFQRQRTDYGSAHWQTRSELHKNKMLVDDPGYGYVVGRPNAGLLRRVFGKEGFIVSQAIPHVLMIAPTRAGKGVGFVIPNLLAFKGSVVVLDVKGENYAKTAHRRIALGDEVFRFAPFDWDKASHHYNPLLRIAKANSFERRYTEVSILADLFLDKANQQNDTFSEAGKTIFVAACLLAIQKGKPTLGEVNRLVSMGENKKETYLGHAGEATHPQLKLLWENAASASERLLTSNIQAVKTAGLKQWDNPAVVRATETNDFDFSTFRKKPAALYICVSEDHIPSLAPLLRLLFADLIATLRLKEPGPDELAPVMIMIDEFQQMGAMPYLEKAIHTLASYGGRVALIAQSLASLDGIYGREGRESLENGAGLKLFITPREERSVKEASASVGKTTVEAVTTSYGRNKGFLGAQSSTTRLEERPLLSETEARFMDPDDIVILAPPQYPIKARRIKWFEDPYFAPLGELPKMKKISDPARLPSSPQEDDAKGQGDEGKDVEATTQEVAAPIASRPPVLQRTKIVVNADKAEDGEKQPQRTASDPLKPKLVGMLPKMSDKSGSSRIHINRLTEAAEASIGLDLDISSMDHSEPMKDEYLRHIGV